MDAIELKYIEEVGATYIVECLQKDNIRLLKQLKENKEHYHKHLQYCYGLEPALERLPNVQ